MNKSQSAYYFKLSADQGLTNAQILIARLPRKPYGIGMDRSKAAHYLKLAADQSSVEA
jgi:TPR repeat protein